MTVRCGNTTFHGRNMAHHYSTKMVHECFEITRQRLARGLEPAGVFSIEEQESWERDSEPDFSQRAEWLAEQRALEAEYIALSGGDV